MDSIIDTQIKAVVTLHDVLNGFHDNKITGTTIMDIKMAQELASIEQDPLLLVILDLKKTYDTLDCGRILHTLEGYRAGPKLQGILEEILG